MVPNHVQGVPIPQKGEALMSTGNSNRTHIEDLSSVGEELSEEDLRLASGGRWVIRTYCPASCTFNCDTDYYLCD